MKTSQGMIAGDYSTSRMPFQTSSQLLRLTITGSLLIEADADPVLFSLFASRPTGAVAGILRPFQTLKTE
jgi:hypothetical protein